MELYLIRHGQSEANASGLHAGWAPVKLTSRGREQAQRPGALIKDIHFDTVIVSDLLRTRQTAELALPGYEYRYDMRVREYGVGNLAGKRVEDCCRKMGPEYHRALATRDFTAYGGENPEMVSARIADFMEEMERQEGVLNGTGKIAVVCHEGAIRHMLSYVFQCQVLQETVCIDNCSVTKLEYAKDHWKLHTWNFCGALT